jgi:hypothetical protein
LAPSSIEESDALASDIPFVSERIMATGRKRPRADLEESQAECPFSVVHPDPNEKEKKAKRKRSESTEDRPPHQAKIPLQVSPFSPMGEFKDPNNTMDRHYQVQPFSRWMDMTRYNSFVLNGVKYYSEGFIFVANSSTIERQKNPGEGRQIRKKSDDDWVARILEIRASDEHHVYARVYWMYWPDELPPGTQEGKRIIQGRQPYHGASELIASNHSEPRHFLPCANIPRLTEYSGCDKRGQCHGIGHGQPMGRE